MKCPYCRQNLETNFQGPIMHPKRGNSMCSIYYQECPHCSEIVVGIYEFDPVTMEHENQKIMNYLKLLKKV